MERDEFAGLIAGIVVLVPRSGGRRDTSAFVPVVALRLFAFVPHERVAGGIEQEDVRAGPVTMRFFVAAHGKLRDVRQHGAARHVNVHVARALAALLARHQVDLPNIRNEIRMQDTAVVFREIFAVLEKNSGSPGSKRSLNM